MRLTVGNLRKIIKEVLSESGGGISRKSKPTIRNPLSPNVSSREQIGSLGNHGDNINDDISNHLLGGNESFDDEYGPVPPNQESPRLSQDPFVRFSSPLPSSPIKR